MLSTVNGAVKWKGWVDHGAAFHQCPVITLIYNLSRGPSVLEENASGPALAFNTTSITMRGIPSRPEPWWARGWERAEWLLENHQISRRACKKFCSLVFIPFFLLTIVNSLWLKVCLLKQTVWLSWVSHRLLVEQWISSVLVWVLFEVDPEVGIWVHIVHYLKMPGTTMRVGSETGKEENQQTVRSKTNTVWCHKYVESEIRCIWPYLWNRDRLTDMENRLAAKGEGGRGGMD